MSEQKVKCPSCGASLTVPPGCAGRVVRCARCQQRFRLPASGSPTDDAIASWLTEDDEEETGRKAPRAEDRAGGKGAASQGAPAAGAEASGSAAAAATAEPIRLVKVDRQGALFEFSASRLHSTAFRTAMPRRCLRCGGRSHLRVHIIVYAPDLKDSISLEAEHAAAKIIVSDVDARDLKPEELLERLPHVPNVPPPGDLPMPYWICDMCSGTGTISGQINVNTVTGVGFCRLLVRSLRRAAEFMAVAGGHTTPDYDELQKHVAAIVESPWDMLPEVVQHRLEQWFRPRQGERFLVYVPDRHLGRTEDGMAGFAITDNRLVYHTQLRHKEALVEQPIELQLSTVGGRGDLCIKTPSWEMKHINLDRDGIDLLRRGLTSGKFHATWH